MAIKLSQGAGNREMSDVNTTPLIDVMLVMLVMMIMTLPMQNHGVTMQSSLSPLPADPAPSINIDIDPDGTIVWNNEPLSGIGALEARFREESGKNPQPQIELRPSALASYDIVADVMASAQRSNMVRMGFANVGEFAE
jgi:biopolymer transport protein ExbD